MGHDLPSWADPSRRRHCLRPGSQDEDLPSPRGSVLGESLSAFRLGVSPGPGVICRGVALGGTGALESQTCRGLVAHGMEKLVIVLVRPPMVVFGWAWLVFGHYDALRVLGGGDYVPRRRGSFAIGCSVHTGGSYKPENWCNQAF